MGLRIILMFAIINIAVECRVYSQTNLIPNTSFENNSILHQYSPNALDQINHMQDWKNI